MASKEEKKDDKIEKKIDDGIVPMRKVRITFFDPDATDSSDEDDDEFSRTKGKLYVHEVFIPFVDPKSSSEIPVVKNKGKVASKATQKQAKRRGSTATKKETKRRGSTAYKGVRKRKWGKFSAEIKDPKSKKKIWLGSFNTAEEASEAYNAKKMEFDKIHLSEKTNQGSDKASASGENNQLCTESSPSSIRESSESMQAAVDCGDKIEMGEEGKKSNGDQMLSSVVNDDFNSGFEEHLLCFDAYNDQPTLDFMEDFTALPVHGQEQDMEIGGSLSLCDYNLGADDMELDMAMNSMEMAKDDNLEDKELNFDFMLDEAELANWIDGSLVKTP